jgi:hypothetical protein
MTVSPDSFNDSIAALNGKLRSQFSAILLLTQDLSFAGPSNNGDSEFSRNLVCKNWNEKGAKAVNAMPRRQALGIG